MERGENEENQTSKDQGEGPGSHPEGERKGEQRICDWMCGDDGGKKSRRDGHIIP